MTRFCAKIATLLICLQFTSGEVCAQLPQVAVKLIDKLELNPGTEAETKKPGTSFVALSAHYRVESDISSACSSWVGDFLESSWPKFRKRFGVSAKPTHGREKFHVYVHQKREDFETAIKAESPDLNSHENHGYYSFKTGNLRVWFDPLPIHFRRLLLHEAAHQFHYSSIGPGRGEFRRSPHWYVEGVAHDIERHEQAGRFLKIGVADSCYFPGFSFEALETVRARRFRLDNFLRGRRLSVPKEQLESRALGWAVVRYFRFGATTRSKQWFKNYERVLSQGRGSPTRGRRRGQDDVDRIDHEAARKRLISFLEKDVEQRAMAPRGEWSNPSKSTYKAHYSHGWFDVLPLWKVSKNSRFYASFMMPRKTQPNEGVGFLIGAHNKKSYVVVQLTGDGKQIYIVRRKGDAFSEAEVHPIEAKLRGRKFGISFQGEDSLEISIGNNVVARSNLTEEQRFGFLCLFAEDRTKSNPAGLTFAEFC